MQVPKPACSFMVKLPDSACSLHLPDGARQVLAAPAYAAWTEGIAKLEAFRADAVQLQGKYFTPYLPSWAALDVCMACLASA